MNISNTRTSSWFFFEAILTLISSLIFGKVYKEVTSLSSITQVQAQILFLSAIFTLVGIVGMIQVLLYFDEEE